MSHPRWVAMKVAVTDKPWAVGELTAVEGESDYHEVASYPTLREANADIARRKVEAASERTATYRERRSKRASRRR